MRHAMPVNYKNMYGKYVLNKNGHPNQEGRGWVIEDGQLVLVIARCLSHKS